jgi:hypothetical protein
VVLDQPGFDVVGESLLFGREIKIHDERGSSGMA